MNILASSVVFGCSCPSSLTRSFRARGHTLESSLLRGVPCQSKIEVEESADSSSQPLEDASRKLHDPSHRRASSPPLSHRRRVHAFARRRGHACNAGSRLAGDLFWIGLAGCGICLGEAFDGPHQTRRRTRPRGRLANSQKRTGQGTRGIPERNDSGLVPVFAAILLRQEL